MAQATLYGPDNQPVNVIDNHLAVLAVIESELEHASEEGSLAFTWNFAQADIDTGDTIIMVQNISDDLILHIDNIWFSSSVAAQYQVHVTNDATTPVGTAITGVCLNRRAPQLASTHALAKGDETANSSQGLIIWAGSVVADATFTIQYGGALLLGPGDAIAIDVVEEPVESNGGITGYFKAT